VSAWLPWVVTVGAGGTIAGAPTQPKPGTIHSGTLGLSHVLAGSLGL
jgi:hypothetical protein